MFSLDCIVICLMRILSPDAKKVLYAQADVKQYKQLKTDLIVEKAHATHTLRRRIA